MTDTQVTDPGRGWLVGQNSDLGLDRPLEDCLQASGPPRHARMEGTAGLSHRSPSPPGGEGGDSMLDRPCSSLTCIFSDVGRLLPPFPNSIPVLSQSHLFIIGFLFVFLFFHLEPRMVALGQDFWNHPIFLTGAHHVTCSPPVRSDPSPADLVPQ